MITHLVVALLIVAPVGVALYLTYWAGYLAGYWAGREAGASDALREHVDREGKR